MFLAMRVQFFFQYDEFDQPNDLVCLESSEFHCVFPIVRSDFVDCVRDFLKRVAPDCLPAFEDGYNDFLTSRFVDSFFSKDDLS